MKLCFVFALTLSCSWFTFAGIAKGDLKITSSAFANGGNIPVQFSREAGNQSPPLNIATTPADTKSLLLIVDDPDASGGLFTHWLVWNIDPKTTAIAQGSVPPRSMVGTNDFGDTRYDGPEPPSGIHRYYFTIFALDQVLDLKAGARRRELERAMRGHILAEAKWMGRFGRRK